MTQQPNPISSNRRGRRTYRGAELIGWLLMGLLLGLGIGWFVWPVEWTGIGIDDLSLETQTHFVSAIADAYVASGGQDPSTALARMQVFENPQAAVAQAIAYYQRSKDPNQTIRIVNLRSLAYALGPEEDPDGAPEISWLDWTLGILAALLLIVGGVLLGRRLLARSQTGQPVAAAIYPISGSGGPVYPPATPPSPAPQPSPAPDTQSAATPFAQQQPVSRLVVETWDHLPESPPAAEPPAKPAPPPVVETADTIRRVVPGTPHLTDSDEFEDEFNGEAFIYKEFDEFEDDDVEDFNGLDKPGAASTKTDLSEWDFDDDEGEYDESDDELDDEFRDPFRNEFDKEFDADVDETRFHQGAKSPENSSAAAAPAPGEHTAQPATAQPPPTQPSAPSPSSDPDRKRDTGQKEAGREEEGGILPTVQGVLNAFRRGTKEPAPDQNARQVGLFVAEFHAGILAYEQSFIITATGSQDGPPVGTCGAAICETLDKSAAHTNHVHVLDVWLYDGEDVRNFSQYLVSPGVDKEALADQASSAGTITGEPLEIGPGLTFRLGSKNLSMDCRILSADFLTTGAQPSPLRSVRIEMKVKATK